jgi:phospholipid/cholesterol/gamma-HCH transport system permease protein
LAHERGINVNLELPEGIRRLLSLAFAVPPIEEARCGKPDDFFLTALGGRILALGLGINEFLAFVGELAQACRRLISGSSHIRAQDFWEAVHECGVGSLPIISLTSLLFGLILAFVGSVQLTQFGAQIYVAGLVSIGMLRIMGAVMVGVVMAGRIGAAYAALMGAMQANEEVDALQAAGIRPVDFLILPRLLAMLIMTPLLTIYAGFLGIVGGYMVADTIMDINPYEYFDTTIRMTPFRHVLVGLVYGTFFGIIIALAGCFHGMRCGRNARAVGLATTTAVVYSIVGVIVATAVITVIASILNV